MSKARVPERDGTTDEPSVRQAHTEPRLLEPVAVILFFTALTLVMTWPWALYSADAINPFGDVVVQMTSLRWNAHALTTNPFGLFEAPFFYPYTHSLAFSENLIGQTIIALPILLITGNAALANNFNILLSFVLTGIFTYWLVRDLTGSRAAGILSGVAFAFCGFRFMQMGHLHMLATQWFSLTLWALHRGLRGKGEMRGHGAFIALAVFGTVAMGLSSVYYTYFLALAITLYAVWWLLIETRGVKVVWAALLPKLAAGVLVTGLVLAPVFWPYVQSNRDLGFSRSIYEVQNWQAEWSFFGNVLQSNWLYGHILAPNMASAGGERELFPGIVPCLLALVGVVWGRNKTRFFYVLLGLFALVLTFGLSRHMPGTQIELTLPYTFFYEWIPGFKALRVPVRFTVLIDMAIYVLAGYGLARILGVSLLSAGKAPVGERLRVPAAVALTALVLLEMVNPLDTANRRDVTQQLALSEPYGWLSRPENSGPVLELPMSAGQDDVWYTFFDTRHWQPLVNGWSSFVPPGTVRLKQALDAFPDPFTVSLLQGLEVRHVVVHLWQFPAAQQEALKRRLESTKTLSLVNRAGDNYVYRVAPNPWLRGVVQTVGEGTLWIGEARHDTMPTLEVLAYALGKWGLDPARIGGNIDVGYKPIGSLPFGTPADYALIPAASTDLPFGFAHMEEVSQNAAVKLLKRLPQLVRSYDLMAPGAPNVSLRELSLSVGSGEIGFAEEASTTTNVTRTVRLSVAAFAPRDLEIATGAGTKVVHLAPGVQSFTIESSVSAHRFVIRQKGGNPDDLKLLRADLLSAAQSGGDRVMPGLMPLEVTPTQSGANLYTRVRVVPPKGADFTATIDVYVEPWGTHPDGHFGSWSVKMPANADTQEYVFKFDPAAKSVTTTLGGQPVETFSWIGPPTQGDFRATLSISRGDTQVANIALGIFTLRGGRLTAGSPESPSLSLVHVGE